MIGRILTAAAIVLAFLLALAIIWGAAGIRPAIAQGQKLEMSSGMACDTPEQVKQVILAEDKNAAFIAVNAGAGPPPCTIALYVYTVTGEVEQVQAPDGLASIVEVVLLRASLDGGVTMFNTKPLTLFMPFLIQAPAVLAPSQSTPA